MLRLVGVAALLIVGIAAIGCPATAAPRGKRPANVDDDAFQSALVAAHDDVRAAVIPTPAAPLPPMSWDDDVAAVAQEWAERCVFEHRVPNSFGENLALFSDTETAPEAVVEAWAVEAADYDYADNSCRPGAQCGHYTQIAWRDSTKLGCGVAVCEDVAGFGPGALWVCNYDPPGNFVGERPY